MSIQGVNSLADVSSTEVLDSSNASVSEEVQKRAKTADLWLRGQQVEIRTDPSWPRGQRVEIPIDPSWTRGQKIDGEKAGKVWEGAHWKREKR